MENFNYYTVFGFMTNELNLSGNELVVYAIIHGFSQDGNNRYTGSLERLAKWTNSNKRTVIRSLQSLLEKGYLGKETVKVNEVTFCEYWALYTVSRFCSKKDSGENVNTTDKMSQGGGDKMSQGGGDKMSPNNNNIYNNINNNIYGAYQEERADSQKKKRERKPFVPPTKDELVEYCTKNNLVIDIDKFLKYYTATDWKKANGERVKDWKLTAVTWSTRDFNKPSGQKPIGTSNAYFEANKDDDMPF